MHNRSTLPLEVSVHMRSFNVSDSGNDIVVHVVRGVDIFWPGTDMLGAKITLMH